MNNDFEFLYPYNGTISAAPLPKIVGEDYASQSNATVVGWGATTVILLETLPTTSIFQL